MTRGGEEPYKTFGEVDRFRWGSPTPGEDYVRLGGLQGLNVKIMRVPPVGGWTKVVFVHGGYVLSLFTVFFSSAVLWLISPAEREGRRREKT